MLSKVELFNARNCGAPIEEGLLIEVKGVGTFKDVDKDGHDVDVSVLAAVTGEVYTTISATVYKSLDDLEEILDENDTVTVKVIKNLSNSGREFYQLMIV